MRLYAGSSRQFIEDTIQNRIADKMGDAFLRYYGHNVGRSEFSSWNNSLQFMKSALEANGLFDNYVALEYELPYTNERIDCMLFGDGNDDSENVVVVELKQWSTVKPSGIEGNILTFVGGAERMVPHPSLQVRGYHFLLKDFVTLFEEKPPVGLHSCVYAHNFEERAVLGLFQPEFEADVIEFPVFTKKDFSAFGEYLKELLSAGGGAKLFGRFDQSSIRPSRRLVEHAREMIAGQKAFTLIDEQITANNAIIDRAKKASQLKNKAVIIVRGGPGTGKSVIALNALSELLTKNLVVFHATGSAAFTKTLRKIVGVRTANFFKYFNSFAKHNENEIDVLVCDEAHRIRKSSNSRYTRTEMRSDKLQIEELIYAAKVSIFFIDDKQNVRPDEIGSPMLIIETAKNFGADIFDFELKTQFRCSGSNGYLNWVDNTLGIDETANRVLTKEEKMEFKIFESPHALYEAVKKKNERAGKDVARLVAGFCWPWSNPNPDGTLKKDVVIGDFQMTWEAKETAPKLAKGIPRASLWAHDPRGVEQIGSIYTIQGFEFEYVGVIFGKGLIWNPQTHEWEGHPENSADPIVKRAKENFTELIKNTYRVLLTRGMKGCYVYFLDRDTENHFREVIESKDLTP